MKRLAIVVATIILTAGSLHAQDAKQLAEEMRKMQQQILTLQSKSDSLERNVTELREKLNAVNGFTQSGGSYVFNAAGGSVTIKASTLVFESTGGLSLKAGGNASIESSASLALKGLGVLLRSNGVLNMEATRAVFEASGSIDVKAGGPLTLKGSRVTSN